MSIDIQHFTTLLQQEFELVSQLHQQLLQEQSAIAEDNLTLLQAAQTQNKSLLEQLQKSATERLAWMESQGLPLNADCLTSPTIASSPELIQIWHKLEQAYVDNQALAANLSDTTLTLRLRTQQKLNVLQGKSSAEGLYNKDGKTNQSSTGPTIKA